MVDQQFLAEKKKVLFSVVGGFTALLLVLIVGIHWIQHIQISNSKAVTNHHFLQMFKYEVHGQADKFIALAKERILTNPKTLEALRTHDRKKLLNLTADLFSEWRSSHIITHLYFHDIERVNILRVHQPNRFGDTINRATILKAEKSGKINYGYELGPLGTLTLRVVLPWFDRETLIGYVEVGAEITHVLNEIPSFIDVKTVIAIDKQHLHQKEFKLGMAMLEHPSNWDMFQSVVLISSSTLTTAILQSYLKDSNDLLYNWSQLINQGDRYYSVSAIPLIDASNKNIGNIYTFRDMSSDVLIAQQASITIIAIGAVVMIIFISIFRSFYSSAEKRLKKLTSAIEQAGESLLITDVNGVIEYVNPAFSKLSGYTADEAIGKTPRILKSGKEEAVFFENMWDTISKGESWSGKVVNRKKDGSFFPAMLNIAPVLDNKGAIIHFIGSQSDLSDLEHMEQQFYQAQKMEAIGTLVGGIAHDFNNILAGMTGNLYLAKMKTKDLPDVLQSITRVEELSFRAAEMIKQLLTFARKGMISIKPISLIPFIKDSLKLIHTSVPENIVISQDICSDELIINGDETLLHQVLMNLVNNAYHAVDLTNNPNITIRLEAFLPDEAFMNDHTYFKAGAYAHLSVEDNGCGIPEHQIEHLFEPFFTTKEVGKGTGLGLAMVFGAIKTHHGYVEVESIEGKSSTFHIYLPLLEKEDVAFRPLQVGEGVKGSGETILLVDDEKQILETGKKVLESLGYKVLSASDGLKAVEIFTANQEEISLVITDIVMPNLSGTKAVERIRKIRPDIKVIFSTGYDKETTSPDKIPSNESVIISKPYNIKKLSEIIRNKLDV